MKVEVMEEVVEEVVKVVEVGGGGWRWVEVVE